MDYSHCHRDSANRSLPRVRTSATRDNTLVKSKEAMDKYDYTAALSLAKKNLAQHPDDYYGHSYLGSIYFEIGDLDRAEAEYLRAEELSPRHYLQERLKEVRDRRVRRSRAQPSATLTPSR